MAIKRVPVRKVTPKHGGTKPHKDKTKYDRSSFKSERSKKGEDA